MDITSFSLGILFVVVVGMLAVTVYNLFRVYKINKEIQYMNQSASINHDALFKEIEENKEHHYHNTKRIESYLDSRIDKLIYRLDRLERQHLGKSNEKQILND